MTLLILFRRKWLLNRPMPQFLYEEVSVRPPSNVQLISIEIYYQRHNGTHQSLISPRGVMQAGPKQIAASTFTYALKPLLEATACSGLMWPT